MNIVGIIPARGGSKGIPRKNIRMLAGKPLVAHTIEAGLTSKYINKVIVSTEDKEIAEVSEKFGAEIIIRPDELAQDETKTAPVLTHVVQELEKNAYKPDIIVLLQPTCPLRTGKETDEAIEKLINSTNDSVFAGFWVSQTMPLWKKHHDDKVTSLYDYHLRPRRQDKHLNEQLFCENGAIYAIKYDAFIAIKDFIGNNPDIYVMSPQVDIDTPEDFKKVEEILMQRVSQT